MTKAKPLSTANTPNDLDPAVVDKLTELDRTDPIEPEQAFDDIMNASSMPEHPHGLEAALASVDPGPTVQEPPPRPDAPMEEHARWAEKEWKRIDPGPTGLDFEAAMALEQGGMTGVHMISSSGEEKTFHWAEPQDLTSWERPAGTGSAPLMEPTANPYILESHTVLTDLNRAAVEARRTIAALDREIADLDRTADEQIALINARRDANVAQREKRKEDLMKIVAADAMVNGQPQEQGE